MDIRGYRCLVVKLSAIPNWLICVEFLSKQIYEFIFPNYSVMGKDLRLRSRYHVHRYVYDLYDCIHSLSRLHEESLLIGEVSC